MLLNSQIRCYNCHYRKEKKEGNGHVDVSAKDIGTGINSKIFPRLFPKIAKNLGPIRIVYAQKHCRISRKNMAGNNR